MAKQRKLYEQVEDELAEEISNGVLMPGDLLPSERDLMERFDVGRPSVREAIFSLSCRGMIEAGSGRRPRVLKPDFSRVIGELGINMRQVLHDPENLFHLLEIRRVLENALARKAAMEATDSQVAELESRLADNKNAMGNYRQFWKTDKAFHECIARISGNPLIPTIMNTLLEWLIDNRRVTITEPGSEEVAMNHHRKIYEGIAAKDPEQAEKAMNDHLLSVERRVSIYMMKNPTGS